MYYRQTNTIGYCLIHMLQLIDTYGSFRISTMEPILYFYINGSCWIHTLELIYTYGSCIILIFWSLFIFLDPAESVNWNQFINLDPAGSVYWSPSYTYGILLNLYIDSHKQILQDPYTGAHIYIWIQQDSYTGAHLIPLDPA